MPEPVPNSDRLLQLDPEVIHSLVQMWTSSTRTQMVLGGTHPALTHRLHQVADAWGPEELDETADTNSEEEPRA